jgi:hypothetical protein
MHYTAIPSAAFALFLIKLPTMSFFEGWVKEQRPSKGPPTNEVMRVLFRRTLVRPPLIGGCVACGAGVLVDWAHPAWRRDASRARAVDTIRTTALAVLLAGIGASIPARPLAGHRAPRARLRHALGIGTLAAATVEIGRMVRSRLLGEREHAVSLASIASARSSELTSIMQAR